MLHWNDFSGIFAILGRELQFFYSNNLFGVGGNADERYIYFLYINLEQVWDTKSIRARYVSKNLFNTIYKNQPLDFSQLQGAPWVSLQKL